MPDITYPAGTVARIADGALALAADPQELLYAPNVVPDSLGGINGFLDTNNKAGDWQLTHEDIQRYGFCAVSFTGVTANRDYFNDWFEGATWADVDLVASDDDTRFISISGAGRTFDVPYTGALTLLSWNICYTNTSTQLAKPSIVKLFVDGNAVGYQRRQVSNTYSTHFLSRHIARDRHWSGHHMIVGLAKGRHSAGLYVCAQPDTGVVRYDPTDAGTEYTPDPATRIRVTGFRAITFR